MAGRGRALPMLVFGVLVALVASLLVTPVASADPAGLELRSAQQLSPRLTQLRVYSPALGARSQRARGSRPTASTLTAITCPCCGSCTAAPGRRQTGRRSATPRRSRTPPDDRRDARRRDGGWYTDWLRGTSEGPQRWETFHLDEVGPVHRGALRDPHRPRRSGDCRPLDGRVRSDELHGTSSDRSGSQRRSPARSTSCVRASTPS